MSSPLMSSASVDEYKSLRDETLKRIDARNQILSYTLVFAAAMFTLALGQANYLGALLVYPVVAFFFATSFAYNSLLLIEIGAYLRTLEPTIVGLGWATHLKPRYGKIEIFELISSVGLFVGTECIGLLIYYSAEATKRNDPRELTVVCWIAVVGTIITVLYPWIYHGISLREPTREG